MSAPFSSAIQSKLNRFCEATGIDIAQLYVIEELALYYDSPDRIISRVQRGNASWDAPWNVSLSQIETALAMLLSRGTIVTVTGEHIRQIEQRVAQLRLEVGPTLGVPSPGDVEFSVDGAKLVFDLDLAFGIAPGYCDLVTRWDGPNAEICIVGMNPERLVEFANECIAPYEQVASMNGPSRIGSWTDRWWRVFAHGWKLQLTTVGSKH